MLKLSRLSLARSGKLLLDNVDLTVFPGERVALVGANGAGKSTLLAALRREIAPESGQIDIPKSWRISHVAQETPSLPDLAVDFVLQGDEELMAVDEAIAKAEASGGELAEMLGDLYAQKQDLDGFSAKARVSAMLFGLGFSSADLNRPVADFSGGWRMRLNLARALGSRADLMLLDEPTNHLDIEAVLWLENWLTRSGKTMIIVSHDREFLDSVASHTVFLSDATLTRYTGGYSDFEVLYAEQRRQQNIAADKQSVEMEKLQKFVDRFRAKASKATQAQSRLKRIEKMKVIASVRQKRAFDFSFPKPDKMPDPLITLVRADCGYEEEKPILCGVTLEVRIGQRIGLLGQNGNGKSTLIKSLVRDLGLLNGEMQPGNGLSVGYFAQHQVDNLRPDDLAIDHLRRMAPDQTEQRLRDFLGRFGFSGDKAKQEIGSMSGGEKARLSLATIIHGRPNLLLLDEPTNHLDIESRDALGEALLEFDGAMVLVSHDRHLLESTTDVYYRVHAGSVKVFDGDLEDYSVALAQEKAELARQLANPSTAAKTSQPAGQKMVLAPVDKKLLLQRRSQLANDRKLLEKKLQPQEQAIAKIQAQIAQLDTQLALPDAYEPQKLSMTQKITQQRQVLEAELHKKEEQWIADSEQIETLELQISEIDRSTV